MNERPALRGALILTPYPKVYICEPLASAA